MAEEGYNRKELRARGSSCKLFWADLKGKKKQCQIQRVREEDGLVVEKRKDIVEVLAKNW